MSNEKPWTAPGLTAYQRALALLGHPTHPTTTEALEAHAADAVKQAQWWIPVAEGLPECQEELPDDHYFSYRSVRCAVIIMNHEGEEGFALGCYFDNMEWGRYDEWGDYTKIRGDVLYWLPLPTPPTEEPK